MKKQPEIFFHVGLGKVASTYLQYRFFPKLKGIHYIQRTTYRRSPSIIKKGVYDRYLVSREFDRQLPDETQWFSSHFPDAKPIILLRRHDQWVASQYRRYVKNGGSLPFEAFLDLENNSGPWKIDEALFYPHILTLEKHFSNPPLVLFYDDLKANPAGFFDHLAGYMGAEYNPKDINHKPYHTSYSEKQLKFMQQTGSRFFNRERKLPINPIFKWLKRRGELLTSYFFLYSANLVPDAWLNNKPLCPPEQLLKIRAFYEEDWGKCLKYKKEYSG